MVDLRFIIKNAFFLIAVVVFFHCSPEDKSADVVNIIVCDASDFTDRNPFLHNVDFSAVKIKSEYALSEIKSMYMADDSLCYAVDYNGALFCIDTDKGDVVAYRRKVGRAKDEVVVPNLITADSTHVYVWDGGKGCILVFDRTFAYQGVIPLSYNPTEFIKVESGFLCYSSGRESSVYLIDMRGEKTYSWKMSNLELNTRSSHVFSKDCNGDVYFMSEYSDTIYKWDDTHMSPEFCISYESMELQKSTSSDKDLSVGRYTSTFFVLPNYILFSFYEGKTMRYGLYDMKTSKVCVGDPRLPDSSNFIPFRQGSSVMLTLWDESMLPALIDMDCEENSNVQLLIWKYHYKGR